MSCVVVPQWHHSPRPLGAKPHQLLHRGEYGMADDVDLRLQPRHVDLLDAAVTVDFLRRLLGNDSQARLYAGQRSFDVEVILNAAFIGEDRAHGRVAEGVAEQGGVDDGGGHRILRLVVAENYSRPEYNSPPSFLSGISWDLFGRGIGPRRAANCTGGKTAAIGGESR